jgi:putative ABC transport system substrate-binding protein
MKRRDLLAGLLPVAVASLATAQQPGKIYRVALFSPSPASLMNELDGVSYWQAMFRELRRLGYEEGRNLKVERYSEGGQEEIFPQLAQQIVATRPDLIFASGGSGSVVAEAAGGRVPVIGIMFDPVASGLSTSLSRPSANVTGIVGDMRVIGAKRFQIIQEVRPDVRHVALLSPPRYWEPGGSSMRLYQQHGVRLTCLCVTNPVQEPAYRQAFANLDHDRPDFINVGAGGENFTYRELIVDLVNETRIPAIYANRLFVQSGGLMSYGWDADELYRHAARQMAAILRGQPVSEVPFYQPTKWELAVNLRTAKGIGLEISPVMLARADLVIE